MPALVYAAQQDIADRYGNDRLLLLAPDGQGGVDATTVQQALDDARGTIDSYLEERYKLPLAKVPPIITRIAVDLAVYYMANDETLQTEMVINRQKNAISDLDKIATGKIKLDVPSPATVGGGVTLQTSGRLYGRDKVNNF